MNLVKKETKHGCVPAKQSRVWEQGDLEHIQMDGEHYPFLFMFYIKPEMPMYHCKRQRPVH